MAPVKFGLFKGRSKDHQEKPSTENLLQDNNSNYDVFISSVGLPVPSTSKGLQEELLPASISMLTIDSDDDDIPSEKNSPIRRGSVGSRMDPQVNYELLQSQSSIGDVSTSLNEYDGEQYEMEELQHVDVDADSTTYDANSSELDITSITASNLSIYCASVKKAKKAKLKEEQKLRDIDMWKASNFEVMQNLLSRSGTSDEQIKWEAIATARGLCTLNDTCTCSDCKMPRYLVSFNDGDAGMAATPLLNAIADCTLQ